MLCKATGAGVEKVMVPTKYAQMAILTPLARRVVGKISDAQTNEGASRHCRLLVTYLCANSDKSGEYLEEDDEHENEKYTRIQAGFVVGALVLPLKQGFNKQYTRH